MIKTVTVDVQYIGQVRVNVARVKRWMAWVQTGQNRRWRISHRAMWPIYQRWCSSREAKAVMEAFSDCRTDSGLSRLVELLKGGDK